MAFKTVEELREMLDRDPELALSLVNRAAARGKDPVSKKNPGYDALRRRTKNRLKKTRPTY